MEPDLELNGESENVNTPAMSGQSVPETNTTPMEQTHPCSEDEEDVEVDITGLTNPGKALVVNDTCGDEIDYSSSFGDTVSETENASFNEPEVESRIYADTSFQRRKKSMTAHWKKFIRPIESRCKWIEMRLKQLQFLAEKYNKELAAYDYAKEIDLAHLTLDGSSIKSVPISRRVHRNEVMKRNKREKVEENCDLASCMSNHTLFSYYNEKAGCSVDARSKDSHEVTLGDDKGNMVEFKLNDLWSSNKNDNTDKSLIEIIEKIEAMQSQVQELKTRYDKVISENLGKPCSENQLSEFEPSDGLNHSDSKHASSDYEGIIDRPEYNDNLWEDIMDVDIIENQVARDELHDLEIAGNEHVKKTKESIEENEAISQVQVPVPAPDSSENAVVHKKHPSFRKCCVLNTYIPKNKRTTRKKPSEQARRDQINNWLAQLHGLRN